MGYLRTNKAFKGAIADIRGAESISDAGLQIPTGYLALSTAQCQLLVYMGDRFLAFTSTLSTA